MTGNKMEKCDHNENRKKVCATCGTKIIYRNKKPEYFEIDEYFENLIKYFYPIFDKNNPVFPLSICSTCKIILNEHSPNQDEENKIVSKRRLPTMPNFIDIVLPATTRGSDSDKKNCNCYVCLTARTTYHSKVIKGRGNERVQPVIDKTNGLYGASKLTTELLKNSPSVSESDSNNCVVKVCVKCLAELSKGKPHNCDVRGTQSVKNAEMILESLNEKQQEQIASNILKRKVESNSNCETKKLKNVHVNLSTFGSKLRVLLNPLDQEQVFYSGEQLNSLKTSTGASLNDMKKLTNFLRCSGGRKIVPPNYLNELSNQLKTLKDLYQNGTYLFEAEKTKLKELRHVVWADAEELLLTITAKRNLTGNCQVKVMADGGQGFFKVSMSVWSDDYLDAADSTSDNKRATYQEGGTCSKTSKLTSVKKLIIICIVPQIKETYDNIKLLFDLIDINKIAFRFVSDLKVLLIINGQQTATATFPCPYCFISLSDLRDRSTDLKRDTHTVRLKTFKDLDEDFQKFKAFDKIKAKAKECHSTINEPLFVEEENVYVIQKCVIPELHVIQGYVNHVFWDGLVPLVGEEKALIWPKKFHLMFQNYHGRVFEGNACRKLLKEADALLDPSIYSTVGKLALVPYVSAFNAMNKVVENCFSSKVVDLSSLKSEIDYLRKTVAAIEISENLKMHILLDHIEECLHFLNKDDGLGLWSEQAGETVHTEWSKIWKKY